MAFFKGTESLISFFMPRGKKNNRKRNNKTVFPELPKQKTQQPIQIVDEKQDQAQKIDVKSEPKIQTKQQKQEIVIKSLQSKQDTNLNDITNFPRFNTPGEIWILPEDYKPKSISHINELEYEEGRVYALTDDDKQRLQNGGFIEFKASYSIKGNIINAWYEYILFFDDFVDTDKLNDEQMKIISDYQIIDHYLYSFNSSYFKPRNTDDRKWCYLHGIEYPFSNILDRNEKNISKLNGLIIGYYGEIEDGNYNQIGNLAREQYGEILRDIMKNSGEPYLDRFFQAQHMFFSRTESSVIHSLFRDLPYWLKVGVPSWRTPLWEIITRYNNCIKFYNYRNWNI